MLKNRALVVFFGIVLASTIQAAAVSFLVIETGLSEDERQKQQSQLWENALFDVFFESGHIVSNAPLARLESKPLNEEELPPQAAAQLEEARNGGADFFVVALLDYERGALAPREISLRMFSLNPYKKVYDELYPGKSYSATKDGMDNLKKIGRELIPYLNG